MDELLHSFPLTFKKAPNKQGGGIEWEYLCRVALELKEGQETRCIVFWRKNMPRGILPSLKRKTNYQQPPMYVFLHSNQTNNLTFDCFECRARQSLPRGPVHIPHVIRSPAGRTGLSLRATPRTPSDRWTFPQSHHQRITNTNTHLQIQIHKYKYTPALTVIPTTMSSAKQP